MFHWICPECGHEIAPTARECPVCDPSAGTAEPALVGVVEAPTAQPVNGGAPRAPSLNATLIPTLQAPRASADGILPQFGAQESPDPLGVLAALLEPPAQAVPQKSFPTGAHAVPLALRALIAELGPLTDQPRAAFQGQLQLKQLKPATETPRFAGKAAMAVPRYVSAIAKPFGALLLPASWVSHRPVPAETPQPGPMPALAPLTHYNPLQGHPLRPAVPSPALRKGESAPRMTPAAPALIQSLIHFKDPEFNPVPAVAAQIKQGLQIPRWLVSAMMIGTVMAAGFNGVLFLMRPASEATPTPAESPATNVAPAVNTASPLAKTIEVTGFRIQMDPEQKPEIKYLVVNHTANAISGVTVYVTLHAASAPAGQAPIAKFQFAAPNLGAFQSKEMASAIERVARPIALPDWQDLRADIEIGR